MFYRFLYIIYLWDSFLCRFLINIKLYTILADLECFLIWIIRQVLFNKWFKKPSESATSLFKWETCKGNYLINRRRTTKFIVAAFWISVQKKFFNKRISSTISFPALKMLFINIRYKKKLPFYTLVCIEKVQG